MKATDVLRKQHDEVRSLFKRLDGANESEQGEIFEELATNLVAHDLIEREIFYPGFEEDPELSDLIQEAMAEHDVMEFSLYQADEAQAEDNFQGKCSVLKEIVMHHLGEEEKLVFPKVDKQFDREQLEQMGAELTERFEEALGDGFRAPLHESLAAAMSGIIRSDAPAPRKRPTRPGARG